MSREIKEIVESTLGPSTLLKASKELEKAGKKIARDVDSGDVFAAIQAMSLAMAFYARGDLDTGNRRMEMAKASLKKLMR